MGSVLTCGGATLSGGCVSSKPSILALADTRPHQSAIPFVDIRCYCERHQFLMAAQRTFLPEAGGSLNVRFVGEAGTF